MATRGTVAAAVAAMVTTGVCSGVAHAEPPEDEDSGTRVSVGVRGGVSVNDDQWVVGGHVLAEDIIDVEPLVLVGIGGNRLTLRPSLRAGYTFWIGDERGFGITPAAGVTALFYVPVGPFATWCHRTGVAGCGGWALGYELGGAVRYDWVRLEAMAGLGDAPVVTVTLATDFQVTG